MNKLATASLMAALGVVGMAAADSSAEKPYDFRARLACVHKPNRVDRSLSAAADEFQFRNGDRILLPAGADRLLRHVAEDFRDYLLVSMGINVSVAEAGRISNPALTVAIDPAMAERAYCADVNSKGVTLSAASSKTLAQAFYRLEDRMNLRSAPFLKQGVEKREMRFSPRMSHWTRRQANSRNARKSPPTGTPWRHSRRQADFPFQRPSGHSSRYRHKSCCSHSARRR